MFVIGNPAYGYVVTVEVEGVVTEVRTHDGLELDSSVIVGSTIMTGSCTYDSETPDQDWPDYIGWYWMDSFSMNIGNYLFIHNPAADEEPYFFISVGNSGFYYDIDSGYPAFYGPCFMDGQPTNLEDLDLWPPACGFGMHLAANIDSPTGDALPDEQTFPDLSVFDEDNFFAVGSSSVPAFVIDGEITSITVIPEPGTVFLLGLGGLALLRKRKS